MSVYSPSISDRCADVGDTGDCWYLSASAILAMHPEMFVQVVPNGEDFQANYHDGNYGFTIAGIAYYSFCVFRSNV